MNSEQEVRAATRRASQPERHPNRMLTLSTQRGAEATVKQLSAPPATNHLERTADRHATK